MVLMTILTQFDNFFSKGIRDEDVSKHAAFLKVSAFEDPCSFPPEPQMQDEPCAEPDSEPAPVAKPQRVPRSPRSCALLRCHEAEDPPPVEKSKSSRWLFVASAAVLAVYFLAPSSAAPRSTTRHAGLQSSLSMPASTPPVVVQPLAAPHTEEKAENHVEVEAIGAEVEATPEMVIVAKPLVIDAKAEPEAAEDADEAGAQSDHYTVTLQRHSFPVSTVGDIVYYRSAYYGTLSVGSPGVPFKVVFDTGSGHLILPSTYCQSETCKAHRRYRRSDSSTSTDIDYDGSQVQAGQPRDQITVSFGTGEVTGVFVEDIVCMGDPEKAFDNSSAGVASSTAVATTGGSKGANGLDHGCVKLRLIAATAMSEEPFKDFKFDGVLGLGLDGLSQAPEFNFLDVVADSFAKNNGQRKGKTPHTFGVFLADDTEEESKITFGGWDDNHMVQEALSWNDVLDPEMGHWTIRIGAIRVEYQDGTEESMTLCKEGCKGVVDTGTSLLAVPSMAFSELYTLLRHPAHMEGHCHGPGPKLHIELDTFTVTLEPEDYSRLERTPPRKTRPRFDAKPHNVSASGRTDLHCKPMLMSMDLPAPLGPKLFILGEPVLRKYYSVYDGKEKRVGFARARHHSKPSTELRVDMTPALKQETAIKEKIATEKQSMFDVFRWRKLHRYGVSPL